MSGYIGPIPVPQGIQNKETFTATAGQTTFNTNGYTDGAFINVYLNGVRLINGTDYTATNGSDIVLTQAAGVSDVLDFETFNEFSLASQQFENITLKNPTHEDTDGGRESAVSFKGEQSGGEISTLAQIQASHDGTSDDQKGDLIFKTNDGSDNDAPTERMRIDSAGTTSITVIGNEDTLNLISTDADASFGPVLNLHRNSASPANSDSTGRINFQAENDADEKITYAQIFTSLQNVADGSEDGRFKLGTMGGGNFNSRIDITNTETVFNDDSKDLNFRVESDGNANALFVDAGNNVVVIGSDVAENRLNQPLAVTSAGARGGITINSFFNSASGPILDFQVSRNDTAGSHTIVQTNDALGTIIFRGDDGDEFKDAGAIECNVDATPGNDDMSGRLSFFTAPDGSSGLSERMRLSSAGDLMFEQFDMSSGWGVNNRAAIAVGANYKFWSSRNSTTSRGHAIFYNPNGAVGSITTDGTATLFNTSSDYRLKENVVDISDGITRVKQLAPKRFNFIADANKTVDGFLAHEAQSVVPEAITGAHNGLKVWQDDEKLPDGVSVGDNKLDEDGNTIPEYQGIDQAKFVPLLTAALKEAITKIETLETEMTSVKSRLDALEAE
jgi:hypothetical protein